MASIEDFLLGIAGNATYDLIKHAWQKSQQKSLQQLYLLAYQRATGAASPRLADYAPDGPPRLETPRFETALRQDLGLDVNLLSVGQLFHPKMIGAISRVMEKNYVLELPGFEGSAEDYRQLVRSLIGGAHTEFKNLIVENEPAFKRSLLDEASGNRQLAQQALNLFTDRLGLAKAQLDSIESKIDVLTKKAEDQNRLLQELLLQYQDKANQPVPPLIEAPTIIEAKKATGNFDVFISYNSADREEVQKIVAQLKQRGIRPWFDVEQLRPGLPWQRELEKQIKQINAAAVFVSKNGLGPWQNMEQEAYIRRFVKQNCPVIPVILPDASTTPDLPTFLEGNMWVDFRKTQPDPLNQLLWGIIGESQNPL